MFRFRQHGQTTDFEFMVSGWAAEDLIGGQTAISVFYIFFIFVFTDYLKKILQINDYQFSKVLVRYNFLPEINPFVENCNIFSNFYTQTVVRSLHFMFCPESKTRDTRLKCIII